MRPPDVFFCMINAFLIVPATCFVLFYTNIRLFGLGYGILFDVFHTASMLNLLRLIYLTGHTEPGIIPAIPTEGLDKSKTYSK